MGCGHRCCLTPANGFHSHHLTPQECPRCALRRQEDATRAAGNPAVVRLADAARRVLSEHNVTTVTVSGHVVTVEAWHQGGADGRCVECAEHWPCSLEELRAAVEGLDVAARPIPKRSRT